ncbi:MAG: S9 family peptidase, partial [Sedimentisphaerales bacterium]|nr:S9 family peptidase [Sedimentisphaerales bacterium]
MKQEKSLSADYILKTLILGSLLAFALTINLQAGQKPEPEKSSEQPYAYLFPAKFKRLTQHLQREDIEVCELREDIELDVEVYRIDRIVRDKKQERQQRSFRLKTEHRSETKRFKAGTILVKTDQEKSDNLKKLLDPATKKKAILRRFLRRPKVGDDYPIVILKSYVPITHGEVCPLKEKRQFNKPITFETIYDPNDKVDFGGSPVSGLTWLKDGEHYLQVRDGRYYKVHAESGRSVLFFDPNELAKGLSSLPTIDEKTAESISKRTRLTMNPDRTAVLIDHENDLYYCTLDGKTAVRLTSSPEEEELSSFDPNGNFVAFVRNKNLYVVDIATQNERALTTDGSGLISNGRADWVYYEEIFGRNWKAYWWSPDSSAIAFMQFDDGPVHEFTVVNNTGKKQKVEETPYPRAGEPNPKVRIGVVTTAGGPVRWIEMDNYLEGTYLITAAGWTPGSKKIYFFVQDRAQTWLDFNTAPKHGGELTCLFREKTDAWVDVPDSPKFLADGSFLFFSERSGWKHLYLYDKDGELKHAVTKGNWEARRLEHVDEKNGMIYVTGTYDSHIAENLYSVKLDSGKIKRLTTAPASHRIDISPNGKYFIDTWSNDSTPTKVTLYGIDSEKIRTLDTNPVYERQEYQFGTYEQFQIEMQDGFLLEASLIKPPDFKLNKKYPVWFMTYGGPGSPTIRNSWIGGRARDHMLAQMGMLVFRCDPRSASGKGACSAWTAYKQLGVQELKDIEEAIEWLRDQPYVDDERIGMSGHSYGGFMTAYALTHSKLFAGGIAGAPVTDWHLYDTIYTERYMDTPQNNPEGYEKTSVVKAAKNLHGKLLIIHGATDDNVHIENTYKFVNALQNADKKFELMIYPKSRHGIGGTHYDRLVADF